MTQALDMDSRVSRLGSSPTVGATTSRAAASSKFGTFAVAFGIAFAILYTLFERQNWPLFTYHPATGNLDFWMKQAPPEDGPPMFWYGWVVLSGLAAAILGWIATMIPLQWLYRLATFCCVLAALWPAFFALAGVIDERASFNAEFLRSTWVPGIPALAGAVAVSYLVSSRWTERAWTGWLLIMPIGGLVILGYSLNTYFLR
ncbi:MAG TPA: hypothetical protein VGN55_25635 [Xanthobacteraceae bacterium]|jgi:hypothetical protein